MLGIRQVVQEITLMVIPLGGQEALVTNFLKVGILPWICICCCCCCCCCCCPCCCWLLVLSSMVLFITKIKILGLLSLTLFSPSKMVPKNQAFQSYYQARTSNETQQTKPQNSQFSSTDFHSFWVHLQHPQNAQLSSTSPFHAQSWHHIPLKFYMANVPENLMRLFRNFCISGFNDILHQHSWEWI